MLLAVHMTSMEIGVAHLVHGMIPSLLLAWNAIGIRCGGASSEGSVLEIKARRSGEKDKSTSGKKGDRTSRGESEESG